MTKRPFLGLLSIAASALLIGVSPLSAEILDVGDQTTSANNNNFTRGFWFTAPVDFYITGIGVPTDASTGNFDVAILKFNTTPTSYPTLTTDFTTLFISQNNAGTSLLPVNIAVSEGDMIGIFGDRNGTMSYHTGPYSSQILGNDVQLVRMGMQAYLRNVNPADVGVYQDTGSIGRVTVQMDSVPEPATCALIGGGLAALWILRRRHA